MEAKHKQAFSFAESRRYDANNPDQFARSPPRQNNNPGVDDLVAHFENFNMEDLGASGSPHLVRSMTERVN